MVLPYRLFYLILFLFIVKGANAQAPAELLDLANKATGEGNYREAAGMLEEAVSGFTGEVSTDLQAEIWHKLGVNYYYTGEYAKAAEAVSQAISHRPQDTAADQIARARSFFLRAAIQQDRDNSWDARTDIRQAVAIMEQHVAIGSDERNTARLMNMYMEYCRINWQLGDYDTALRYRNKAFRFFSKNPAEYSFQIANLQLLKANILKRRRQFSEAIPAYEEAIAIWGKSDYIEDQVSMAGARNNLGLTHLVAGRASSATDHFLEALADYRRLAQDEDLPYYQQEITNVYANLIRAATVQNVASVQTYYDQGLAAARRGWPQLFSTIIADLHLAIAEFELQKERYPSALEYVAQSIRAAYPSYTEGTEFTFDQAIIGDKVKLLEILQLKLRIQEAIYAASGALSDLETAILDCKPIDDLLVSIRRSYELSSSKYELISQEVSFYERAISLHLEYHQKSNDENYLERAYQFSAKNKLTVLLEGLQAESAKFSGGLPSRLIKEERDLKKKYYQLERHLYEAYQDERPTDQLQDSLFHTGRSYRRFIDQLEQDFPKYYQLKYAESQSPDPGALHNALPENALLIEYFLGEKEIFIFSLHAGKLKYHRVNRPADLNQLCTDFRQASSQAKALPLSTLTQRGYRLFELLVQPVIEAWPEAETAVKRLIIIPDQQLLQISFEVLPFRLPAAVESTYRNYPFLLRKYAINYEYSNRFLTNRRDKKKIEKRKRFAGFGLEYDDFTLSGIDQAGFEQVDTVADGRAFGPLVYADDEVREIGALMQGKTWINRSATKAAFLENAREYKILHLSMHGLVDETNPLHSALVFSRTPDSLDYLLRSGELFAMELNADMAVLSACHTGYGPLAKGEGIRSLARAFTYAGCQSLVASLWSASDQSSMHILTRFYRFLNEGMPKDVALQQAKLEYLDTAPPTLAGPDHWAHLIQIGDWSEVEAEQKEHRSFWVVLLITVGIVGLWLGVRRR